MAKAYYTDDELVARMTDKEEVKDVMARHSWYYSNDQRREELCDIWVKSAHYRRTASLANNIGYYVGMEDISNYYVVQHNEIQYARLKAYSDADPSVGYDNLHLGLGFMAHHTVNTPLCYIAEDGKTAK